MLLGETDVELLPARDRRDGDILTWTLTGGADQNAVHAEHGRAAEI